MNITDNTTNTKPAAPSQPISAADPAPRPRKHRRHGSVARLPKMERDLINQMLSDGATYRDIADALEEFGHKLTLKNISNWTKGGHLDWLKEQESVLENRRRQDSLIDLLREDDAFQLPKVGLQLVATALSELLSRSANVEEDINKYLAISRALCHLTRELFRLQKYRDDCARSLGKDHRPERIKHDNREFAESLRQSYGPNPPPDDHAPEPPRESASMLILQELLKATRAKTNTAAPPAPVVGQSPGHANQVA